MFAALFRLLFGLIVACLVSGAVQVLFAFTPAELAVAGQERWEIAANLTLFTAITSFMIAAPIVLLLGLFAEFVGVRSFAFYLIAGLFVALAGFAVLYSGERPNDPTIVNSYAIAAFLTSGFFSGISYWLVAGRFAGGRKRSAKLKQSRDQTRDGTAQGGDDDPAAAAPSRHVDAKTETAKPVIDKRRGSVPSTAKPTPGSGGSSAATA
ncbi:MAG: hypothetical protein AAFR70_04660 [Pseudomonadota bacterium]